MHMKLWNEVSSASVVFLSRKRSGEDFTQRLPVHATSSVQAKFVQAYFLMEAFLDNIGETL